ncbi:MAG: hypothetical protein ACRDRU_01615 [Pseudonocardiaceae bacterium]
MSLTRDPLNPHAIPWVSGGHVDVLHTAQRWVESAALQRLVVALGGPDPLIGDLYAPYQFFAGAPVVLSDGAEYVELVGTPTGIDGDINLLTQRIAQEIHAAMNAAITILH